MTPALSLYERWVTSWDAALAALASAGRIGLLSADETAQQRETIATERDLVTRRLTLLVGQAEEA